MRKRTAIDGSVANAASLIRIVATHPATGGARKSNSVPYFDVTIRDKADRHAERQILSVVLVLFAESGSGVSTGSGGIFRLGWYSVQMDSVPIE